MDGGVSRLPSRFTFIASNTLIPITEHYLPKRPEPVATALAINA